MSTQSSTFNLKSPKGNKETLILFSCYFKYEEKKFVYSTGEKIHPKNWDFKNRQPFLHGKNRSKFASTIRMQVNRYRDKFEELQARSKAYDEEFTRRTLREEFNREFKRAPSKKNLFFEAFDAFIEQNQQLQKWSPSTAMRYQIIKRTVLRFQEHRDYNVTFNNINDRFHAEFTEYCMGDLGHINNTFSRNMGLLKTFLFWALKNGYTYKENFKDFKLKPKVITNQIALTLDDLENLMRFDFTNKRLEKIRDVFVFACVTGLRFGELKLIGRDNISADTIILKEEKDSDKSARNIPLNELALYILRKYNYELPLIANQKHNQYIKEVFKVMGYNQEVQKVTTRGIENIREKMLFYERISTHTARRTFITMMKKKGVSDKLIASITGHTDMKTLNQYYQVDDDSKLTVVQDVFKLNYAPLKKVN
jgi:integrase